MLRLDGHEDGAVSDDGAVMGCYLHGLFDSPQSTDAMLAWAGLDANAIVDYAMHREQQLDRLADMLEGHMDMTLLKEKTERLQAGFDALS
ncbi:MAG: hypothetical protein MI751_12505, partial [Pseudomonadales bacterium]|nr:hypothetical protein [Pseudomonadales bacterium]